MGSHATGRSRLLLTCAAVAVVVLSIAALVRIAWADRHELGSSDLDRFETAAGVDLPDWYGETPFFLNWTRGDGAAFVGLAADLDLNDTAQRLGTPRYRHLRVGYAWLGRAFAFGSVGLIPVGLFAVNVLAVIVLAFVTARLERVVGPRAFLLVANPAVYVAFLSDTAELVAVAALSVGLSAPLWWSRAGAALVGITRPSMIPALGARGLEAAQLLAIAMAALAVVAIRGWIALPNGEVPVDSLAVPFVGFARAIDDLALSEALPLMGLAVAAAGTAIIGVVRCRGWVRVGWSISGLLVLMLGEAVLGDVNNWSRAAAALPVLWAFGPDGSSGLGGGGAFVGPEPGEHS